MTTTIENTKFISVSDLTSENVIVLENGTLNITGGISASSTMSGFIVVETEVGSLYLDPETEIEVEA